MTKENEHDLTLADIRKAVKCLTDRDMMPTPPALETWSWKITTSGVVLGPYGSWMHLNTFKDLVDEETYNRVLAQPRVVHPYDLEETQS
jgi:hypothetical protein